MRKTYVMIQGPVCAMKSSIARLIRESIEKIRPDLSCDICDHELFTFYRCFESQLSEWKKRAESSAHDICVVVVGTGCNDGPLTIQVEPALWGSEVIFETVIDYLVKLGKDNNATDV